MGINHSLSSILGLTLVALFLTLCGTMEGMATFFVVSVVLEILAFFGEREV